MERAITLHQDMLFRFAFFRTGSLTDAEDIVQEVFLKMYDGNRNLSRIENMKGYLLRSVSNACNDCCKRRKKRTVPLEQVRTVSEESDGKAWEREYTRIEELLAGLPCEQAEVIRLRCTDGLRFTEIAGLLRLPVTTVKSRFGYGIDKLRKMSIAKEDEL